VRDARGRDRTRACANHAVDDGNGPKTSNVGTGGMSSMKGSSMKGSSMKSSSAKTKTKPAMKTKSTPAPK
jgi:hypothetical protein